MFVRLGRGVPLDARQKWNEQGYDSEEHVAWLSTCVGEGAFKEHGRVRQVRADCYGRIPKKRAFLWDGSNIFCLMDFLSAKDVFPSELVVNNEIVKV